MTQVCLTKVIPMICLLRLLIIIRVCLLLLIGTAMSKINCQFLISFNLVD